MFLLVEMVSFDSEHSNHDRQRQALNDKRAEDDAEREEHDQVTLGNALPPSVVKGIASAAASETAPRMPAHATTKARPGGGGGLFGPPKAPRNLLGR